ncbi:hypothetical protein MARBORIA2_15140 [Methanobrevibacter arboriphilus]|uniref:hypothetical protein n=1 Tax=Methanobrevibacter arboriphilus TaxID=39441 RepID=UPI0022EE739B|nr:hypothetical protein [Methanobrevibacter arboriphilus]GLI12424.1 hypothetical protein MARBORIA2_15140 [Methanobrevibacter arboriphilus]
MKKDNVLEKKLRFLNDKQSNITSVKVSTNTIGRIKPQTFVMKKQYHYSIRG